MDKVKAIKVLKPLVDSYVDYANITMKEEDDDIVDALEMAIEALKALDVPDMNVGDMISRQMAIDSLHGYFDGMLETDTWSPCDVYGLIELLPAAQPATNCSEIPNSSDDTISRQAAIDVALEDVSDKRTHEFNAGAIRAVNRIKSLPSAQPKGHWIPIHPLQEDDAGAYMCSECKVGNWEIDPESYFFCPNCGARMQEGG